MFSSVPGWLLISCVSIFGLATACAEAPGQSNSGTSHERSGTDTPTAALVLPSSDSIDMVTEQLFRQYVVGRGKISTRTVNAAIELVAARGQSPAFAQAVVLEFERSCEDENASSILKNLMELISKMLAVDGNQRWIYELAHRNGQTKQIATTAGPSPSPTDEKIYYRQSEMLERVISRGRQANRHNIDAFVIAVRQAHHPRGKQFLLDVLQNQPDPLSRGLTVDPLQGKWPDNLGGTWLDAKFHAAVGLAELGEHAGVEWLIKQSELNDFGVGSMSASLFHAPHRKAASSNLRESCLHALADLFELPATSDSKQWTAWWAANKDHFQPKSVALQLD